jgi:hypothetical protein
MLPLRAMKAASRPRTFVRFKYSLSSSNSLLIRSHEDTETSIGPYDLGFLITHEGKAFRSVTLRTLPEFRREDKLFAEAFTTVAIARVCGSARPMYFITMKYMGDELSPALVFVVLPSAEGFKISPLPMFSGGAVDVSTADPLHLRIWNNLNEGSCNACGTAYSVTDYRIRDGMPKRIRQRRTKRLYSSDQFPESRIRFVP